ncbi:hypothetical protein CICLE_v10010033mg [Citrus x clementina]|uniref:Uncharacterized protein n=1 Tax=Citrus clementina TaxID=85681 RepID=V4UP01_CITCL|nr:hypothetical protein CICLE_v10010033mg [Citrus x clementina]
MNFRYEERKKRICWLGLLQNYSCMAWPFTILQLYGLSEKETYFLIDKIVQIISLQVSTITKVIKNNAVHFASKKKPAGVLLMSDLFLCEFLSL